jgi:hypothetical protein
MISEYMERPLRPDELEAGEALERRIADAKAKAMDEVMTGTGPFWADWHVADHWDNEQHTAIALAVGAALADETLTGDQFRAKVMASVRKEGLKYAASCASDVE